jgi:rare lipoprotein A
MKGSYRIRAVSIATAIVVVALLSTADSARAQTVEEGWANFYSDNFHGKKMSNGEPYDKDKLTASTKNIPSAPKSK